VTFQRNHLYLTLHWFPANYPLESGQTGIRFDQPTTVPTQALVDAAKTPVQTMWAAAATRIAGEFQLKYLRLARIGVDGHYVAGSSSFDSILPTPLGGGGGAKTLPLQSAAATTLTTGIPHGQASKGRIYLPPIQPSTSLPQNDLWAVAEVDARSTAVAQMITALNTIFGGPAAVFSQGTVRGGTPLVRSVTSVFTGRRPDVQRRRAKSVPDVPGGPITVS
jgi:hypothetical protein